VFDIAVMRLSSKLLLGVVDKSLAAYGNNPGRDLEFEKALLRR
jgi:hypothetical protein